jgi:putative transposase
MLHVISLAKYAAVHTRSWAADSLNARVRFRAERDHSLEDAALQREEMRIKDARMTRIPAPRRPYYTPAERLAILEVRAARGWSVEQTANAFLVTAATVTSWMKRLDEQGSDALVQLPIPVNKFPDFVRYTVQRLQTLCPTLGKKKLAEILARAGLHLGTTTIGRIRKENPVRAPSQSQPETIEPKERKVTAKRPNHVWHVDLTTLPTQSGFWCSWLPLALPQRWPFCWWLVLVLDHYSRRIMGFGIFRKMPTSLEVRVCLGRVIAAAGASPRYLISDKGSQFWPCPGFARWCGQREIRPRFGAIGKHGSIAVIERALRTLKEALRLTIVPTRRESMRREMCMLLDWYNQHRPHMTLGGKTPDEVYFHRFPANRRPRIEARPHWPRGSACALPHALIAGKSGLRFNVQVERLGGHAHLPIVRLQRAA